ncbi:hypothetical protein CAPI_04665 [Corynebacterium capitovis DSM 44611]|uniref:TIGR03085 family metal-binding protein n=1 Tax=Corynebacterium capitovis TaxID=131081 RepID=UPI0003807671|nr:TIGR03085 family metal-binding protein [Corynebacterium capitovis]WKD57491.1 hypothetical protein CAPI_04665 [Corynebacterium capitovis DSM 44611]
MTFAAQERAALGTLLLDVGPDAPTQCEGWTTRDLAIHLFIREHKVPATFGNFVPAFAGTLNKEVERQKQRPYEDVVRDWSAGPPAFLKPVDAVMNGGENFIHHEDVRRGDGHPHPREFSQEDNSLLLTMVKRFSVMALHSSPVPVILTPPHDPPVTAGGKRGVARRGDDVVRVFGMPGELLLWTTGRVADVRVEGDKPYIDKLRRAL